MGVSTHSGPWMGAAQAAGNGSDDAGKKKLREIESIIT